LSQDRLSIVTFASAGFLIASILIFGLVAMPELLPAAYPQLRYGTVGIRAISTSGQIIGPPVYGIEITVDSIRLHRVGVGEGTWINVLKQPVRLNPIEMAGKPVNLNEVTVPIGDYNLMGFSFGNVTATISVANVTLKVPTQEFKTPVALTVREGKHSNLVVDLSFNEPAVSVSESFDPYITVTVEQPGRAPLSTIANLKPITSMGPDTLAFNQTKSYTFTVEPGAAVDNYLVHVEAVPSVENTFDLAINETGEYWYDLTGNLWFLGGNLTSGTYHANVQAGPGTTAVTFAITLYSVPRITGDLPDAAFSGFIPARSSLSIHVNEFALHLDQPGSYDFYLGVKAGDYEFLIDNNPTSVVNNDQMVTLQLDSGLHTFQIFADFSGSGRETSWSVGVVPVTGVSNQPLSREAMLSTGLLMVAALVFVVDVSVRYVRRKRLEDELAKSVQPS
jgi:hypothetical protein